MENSLLPAAFSHQYHLKTVPQSNDKGTWFGWSVSKIGVVQDGALYQQAKAFALAFLKEMLKLNMVKKLLRNLIRERITSFSLERNRAGDGRLDPALIDDYGKKIC